MISLTSGFGTFEMSNDPEDVRLSHLIGEDRKWTARAQSDATDTSRTSTKINQKTGFPSPSERRFCATLRPP